MKKILLSLFACMFFNLVCMKPEAPREKEITAEEAEAVFLVPRARTVVVGRGAFRLQELPYFPLLKPVDIKTRFQISKKGMSGDFYSLEEENLKKVYGDFAYDENKKNGGIRSAYFFCPNEINKDEKPIVLLLVHGTGFEFWGQCFGGPSTKAYYDISCPIFKDILNFAYNYSVSKKTNITILSFRWNGANSIEGRRDAAYRIGQLLLARFKGYRIITYSHSHGGNVINAASHFADWKYQDGTPAIDLIINMGTPDRTRSTHEDAKEYEPTNFKTLINFWSPGDWIQILGSVGTLMDAIRMFKQGRKLKCIPLTRIYNICIQINGEAKGHSAFVEPISANLFKILEAIQAYKLHTDLNLNISTTDSTIQLSIRHPLEDTEYYQKVLQYILDPEKVRAEGIEIDPELRQIAPELLKVEKVQSEAAKKTFRDKYGKEMAKSKSNYLMAKADKRKGFRIAV